MPAILTLSDAAVALLRFHVKGWRSSIRACDVAAYQELVEAAIMEPVGAEFRLTAWAKGRSQELVDESYQRIESTRNELPDARNLSEEARSLLRRCVTGQYPDGDENNRRAYQELVEARIMMPMGSFSKGDQSVFRFTYWGWRQRFELAQVNE